MRNCGDSGNPGGDDTEGDEGGDVLPVEDGLGDGLPVVDGLGDGLPVEDGCGDGLPGGGVDLPGGVGVDLPDVVGEGEALLCN